ncbi:MAG: class I SAM-dependent methyltransferase [Clostridiaceae bacterium]|jgi:SAM-dependent methyltransferase|nr:class I SAM-dependent methyltransferase [Clostridiaceae bacterium]
MSMQRHIRIFNKIAPVYALFFGYQLRRYRHLLKQYGHEILAQTHSVLDIGCGTGALVRALSECDLDVCGVDGAERMIQLARRFNRKRPARFAVVDAQTAFTKPDSEPLSQTYDLVVASYVLHGLQKDERQALYAYMRGHTRRTVVIMDYNQNRSWLTSLIERMEGGDYFRFIEQIHQEMQDNFPVVQIVQTGKRSAWYICRCSNQDRNRL